MVFRMSRRWMYTPGAFLVLGLAAWLRHTLKSRQDPVWWCFALADTHLDAADDAEHRGSGG